MALKRTAESPEDGRKQAKKACLVNDVCSALLQSDIKMPFFNGLVQLLSITAPSALEQPEEQRRPEQQLLVDLFVELLETAKLKFQESTSKVEQDMQRLCAELETMEARSSDLNQKLQAISRADLIQADSAIRSAGKLKSMLQDILHQELELCVSVKEALEALPSSDSHVQSVAVRAYLDRCIDCEDSLRAAVKRALSEPAQERSEFQRMALGSLQQKLRAFEVELLEKTQELAESELGCMDSLLFQQPFGERMTAIVQSSCAFAEERRADRVAHRGNISRAQRHCIKVRERFLELTSGSCDEPRKAAGYRAFIKQSLESMDAESSMVKAICPELSFEEPPPGSFDEFALESMQNFLEAKLGEINHDLDELDKELACPPKQEALPLEALAAVQQLKMAREEAKADAAKRGEHEELLGQTRSTLAATSRGMEALQSQLGQERRALGLVDETSNWMTSLGCCAHAMPVGEAGHSAQQPSMMNVVLKLFSRT